VSTEPPAERMPASVREWTDILARIRFGTVKIAGKNVTGPRIKLVAGRLANYADGDGTRVRPGIARLSVDLEMDYRIVGSIVAHLRRLGLLGLVRPGGGAKADEYRLTLPVDLLDRDDLEVWSPGRQTLEIERVRRDKRGARKVAEGSPEGPDGDPTHVPQGDASDDGAHVPEGDLSAPQVPPTHVPQGDASLGDARPTGRPEIADARPTGSRTHVPQGQATFQDLDTRTTHHSGEDVAVTVTAPGATGSTAKTDSSPRPQQCYHGLPGGLRSDGKPTCALCRVGAPPTIPPRNRLADVIQLTPRRTA
jgi:hypothetical protein